MGNFGGFTTPTPVAIGSSGSPNWGTTFAGDLGELANRPEFGQAVREEVFNSFAWIQSGAIQRDERLDARTRGASISLPLINPFVPASETIKSTDDWGASGKGYLTPQKLNAGDWHLPIVHRGFAAGADELSEIVTGIDPMAAIESYIVAGAQRLETLRALATMEGALRGPLASTHRLDISRTGAGPSDADNFLSSSAMLRAKSKLGERGSTLQIACMHSDLANYLASVGMLTFSSDSLTAGGDIKWGGGGIGVTSAQIADMAGFRVIVDDLLAPTIDATNGDKYPVYLMANGAIRQGIQRDFRVRYGENILSFQEVLAADWHGAMGVLGVSWVGGSPENPVDSELIDNTHWELVYTQPRMVPIVKITCNCPFAINP
jgi:hypothetical protein